MSPTQFKVLFAVLAVAGAALGGGVAFIAMRPAGPDAAKPAAKAGTVPHWNARVFSVAGDGMPGLANGIGKRTRFADPFGVVIDQAGNLYVADGGDSNNIRKIDLSGNTTTLAGAIEGYAEGAGRFAAFNTPSGLAIDGAGNLYVADTGNNAIRKITPDGIVSTLAGDGMAGNRDGKGQAAQFNGPIGLAVDAAGVVYVADTYNDRIRRIAVNGEVTTIAGGGRAGLADGEAAQALFNTPCGLALAANGDLYIADTGNSAVRKLGKDGKVSTIALAKDDDRKSLLRQPIGIAVTKDSFIYIASAANGRVAQISPAGEVAALPDVDHPEQAGYGSDGTVRLYAPRGLALDRDGSLYISDAGTYRLVHVTPPLPGEEAPPENPLPGMPSRPATMLWPVKPQNQAHEVVGLMGEVRGNFEGESRDHFHSGLDVQAAVGTPVLTVVAGKVTDPRPAWGYGELAEGISLDGLRYIHMRVGRAPNDKTLDARFAVLNDEKGKPAAVRVKRGTRFLAGETVGTVNRMAHVHLDYVPNGDALNPLSLPFIDLNDTIEPQIQSITLTDANGLALKEKVGDRLVIKRELGEVQIVVEAYDQMNGDQARRKLGIYKLGYQLLSSNGDTIPGMEQPVITQVYDRLPRNREAVKLMYAGSSGITVHGAAETRFIYALNNTLLNGKAKPTGWKVSTLGPGNYILRILAADYAGNVASKGRDLAVVVD